ncbi:hypothetical protein [Deinococcus gobiensis]|uniref:Uncharacterized protein n=1 Tax=Deinococcus gobiensis (strain DSM 21396 / JCM 16679 / CGMCC 1.7299 / I-0) TaxID=745776 RepID=H8GXN0_DEIGI|nr:hypothetical protein [Deinococcus gobiensis]AFD25882.1 hypothetical protein DGo_CA1955 [Deinococcus gobiensis I-0]
MIDADTINAAFHCLRTEQLSLANYTALETRVRTEIESKKAELLALGIIDGKNAEIREGQLRDRLASEHLELSEAQGAVAEARTGVTIAQIEVDRCKTLLRLLEVTRPS